MRTAAQQWRGCPTGFHAERPALDGLALPDVPSSRLSAGRRVVRSCVGRRVTVPVRRLVARG